MARARPKDDLRARILASSVQLITTEGLSALSFREVARRAGVSHQAPYHHFADKEAILAALAEEGFLRLADALEACQKSGGKSAVDRLDAGGRAYVRFAAEHPAHFRLMFRPELVDVERHEGAKAQADRAYAALEALVRDVVTTGLLAPKRAPGVALVAWAMVHGLATLMVDGPLAKTAPGTAVEAQLEAAFASFRALLAGGRRAPKPRGR